MNIPGSIVEEKKTIIEENLSLFPSEYTDEIHCLLELLKFWARHPNTRFNQSAIFRALESKKLHIEGALKYLIARGVVRMHTENGIPLYSLTRNESLRNPVLELAKGDAKHW